VLQALAVKALNDLPAKHGKRPNVKNPPLDHCERPHLPASESRIDRLARMLVAARSAQEPASLRIRL
jgi:hypothetical protein